MVDIPLDVVQCENCVGQQQNNNDADHDYTLIRNVFRKDETNYAEQDVFQFVFDKVELTELNGQLADFEIFNKYDDKDINVSKD